MKTKKSLLKAAVCMLAAAMLAVPFTAQVMAQTPLSAISQSTTRARTDIFQNDLYWSGNTGVKSNAPDSSFGFPFQLEKDPLSESMILVNFGFDGVSGKDNEKLVSAKIYVTNYSLNNNDNTRLDLWCGGRAGTRLDRDTWNTKPSMGDSPIVQGLTANAQGEYVFDISDYMYETIKKNGIGMEYFGYNFGITCSDPNSSIKIDGIFSSYPGLKLRMELEYLK